MRTKKNIFYSLIFKCGSIFLNFLTVPILLNYLNATRFGVWLTLSSIVAWIGFLDIGLGNGLRNKLSEALAKNNTVLGRSYVSTTYAAVGGIVIIILLTFFAVSPFLNWSSILNTSNALEDELSILVSFMMTFFALKFLSSLVNTVLIATQNLRASSMIDFLISLISLLEIIILSLMKYDSLLVLGLILGFTNFVVPLIVTIWLFKGKYKNLAPSFRCINVKHLGELSSVGLQFFFIQIAVIIIFSTSNIIIIQLLNAEEVTKYNIVFKYFSIVPLGFGIIITPFWSAFTEAYFKGDVAWIERSTKKLKHLWMLMSAAAIIMVFISPYAYEIWVGKSIKIPFSISVLMGFFVIISTWNNIYVYFINGIGKIRLQLYLSIFVATINIPLSLFFVRHFGTAGVVLSSIVCLIPAAIMMPIQYKKIIKNQASGLYNL